MKNKINNPLFYIAVIPLFIISLILIGCNSDDYNTNSNPPGDSSDNNQISMQSNAFSPAGTTVDVGTTVTWINNDSYNHTVTSGSQGSPDGMFDSGNIGANGTYSFKFDRAGTFNYYCKLHSPMAGTITVR